MQRASVIAIVMLAIGCEDRGYGRSDVIPIRQVSLADFSTATLLEAEEWLGFELAEAEPGGGAVGMVAIYGQIGFGEYEGYAEYDYCYPLLWAEHDKSRGLAHEIGHALGLSHHPDEDNLMFSSGNGGHLTEDQVEIMRISAWYMMNEC